MELSEEATSMELRVPPVNHGIQDSAEWASATFAACNGIISQCRQASAKGRFSKIKRLVNSRFTDYLSSLDGTGKLSNFLRRAGHDGSRRITHQQAYTERGASTHKDDIHAVLQQVFRDWFAARKEGSSLPDKSRENELIQELYVQKGVPKSLVGRLAFEDLLSSLATAPGDSCPGPSGIDIKLLRKLPGGMLKVLLGLHNLMLSWGCVPDQFKKGFIYPIPKKGAFSVENSRPISLLEVHFKLLTRTINRRLMHRLTDEEYFSAIQYGFRPGRSCAEAFHTLLGAIEDSVEFKKKLHLCLVDLTKAFDSLSPSALQQAYIEAGLDAGSCAFMGAIDGKGKAQVLSPFGSTGEFTMEWGVRQGEVLSPAKFIMWLNPWLEMVYRKFPNAGYRLRDGTRVLLLAYADDIAILTDNHEDMQAIMSSLCEFLHYHGVTLSADSDPKKSKTVYCSPQNTPLVITSFNRDSRPGQFRPANRIILKPRKRSHVFVYLGGRLSLDLDWPAIRAAARKGVDNQLRLIRRKRYSLSECATYASSVISGKAGYLLQVGQFPLSTLAGWDSSLDVTLRIKAGVPYASSSHMFHAPKERGGLGIYSFSSLALQATATELLVRLNSRGLAGEVARERFRAAYTGYDWSIGQPATTGHRVHFIRAVASRLRRYGYCLTDQANLSRISDLSSESTRLCDGISDMTLVKELEAKGFQFMEDITVNGTLKPYAELRVGGNLLSTPAWYITLRDHLKKDELVIRARVPIHSVPAELESGSDSELEYSLNTGPPSTPAPSHDVPREATLGRTQPSLTPGAQTTNSGDTNPLLEWISGRDTFVLSQQRVADVLIFATDGSVDRDHGAPIGGYASVTPHPLPGWTLNPSKEFFFRGKGVRVLGAEPIAIDSMELLALVDLLENAPHMSTLIYVDASYILHGASRRRLNARAWVRQSNRALWRRFDEACAIRERVGAETTLIKCSSHGKDSRQHTSIDLWNGRADRIAERFRIKGPFQDEWWLRGDLDYVLLYRGQLVRGDPRLHIRDCFEEAHLEAAQALGVGGYAARLVCTNPGVSICDVVDCRSPYRMAKIGDLGNLPFAMALQNLALCTPNRSYTKDPDKLASHLPRGERGPICPLCQSDNSDTWHYATQCPVTAHVRQTIRRCCGSLLAGLSVASELTIDPARALLEWFRIAVQAPSSTIFGSDTYSPESTVVLRVLIGKSEPSNSDDLEPLLHTWQLVLCSPATFEALKAKRAGKARSLVMFKNNRFPQELNEADKPVAFVKTRVVLCTWGKGHLPVLSDSNVKALVSVINDSILFGTHGCTLTWGKQAWQLDSGLQTESGDPLDGSAILPLESTAAPPTGFVWDPGLSWLGFLPRRFPLQVHRHLKGLSRTHRKQFRYMLRSTILRGQETSWALSRRFIIECLKRNRSIHRCFSEGRMPPPYRPVFATIDTYKASFPPSQSTYNLALRYFETNYAISSSIFFEKAALLGISKAEVPDVWIAILSIRDRLGAGAEDAIRNGSIPEDLVSTSVTGICLYPEDKLRRTPKEKVVRYALPRNSVCSTGSNLHKSRSEALISIPRNDLTLARPSRNYPGWFSPTLSSREEKVAAAVMRGTCLTSVPHRAALSSEGRFHDIRCLRDRQWITTAVFDDLTPKLTAWLNSRSCLSWKIRSADTFQALEANQRTLRDNFVNNIRRDVAHYDRVIFPCCFNRHWVILVTSKNNEEGILASFNSKEVLGIDGARRVLLKVLNASPPAGPSLTTTWRCAALPCVQQNNWTDCGVHALFNIIRLKYTVEHRPVPRLPEVVVLRKRLASLLGTPLTDRVWT